MVQSVRNVGSPLQVMKMDNVAEGSSRSQWFYSSISIDVVKMQTLGVLQAPLLSLQHNEIPSLLLRSGLK
ncbi:hypothetical protein V6N13_067151 [Hibiscus sabdariffa]|uniref:Uncharacterized protein n=1 Tax=Hibiscus sabdariffa TaxID=183260 RepID=A0ABR2DSK7_9ROSI